jgi:hypothetical protein
MEYADAIGGGGLFLCQNAAALKGYEDSNCILSHGVILQPDMSGSNYTKLRSPGICLVRLERLDPKAVAG